MRSQWREEKGERREEKGESRVDSRKMQQDRLKSAERDSREKIRRKEDHKEQKSQKKAIGKSKSLKTGSFVRLLEVEMFKICTTLWRESNRQVKIVKTGGNPCSGKGQ